MLSGSLGSFWCALGVVVYIRCRCVDSGAPWGNVHSGSLGSFRCTLGVVRFIRVCPGGSWVNSGLLGSFECALVVVGFVVVVWYIQGRWIHSGVSWVLLGSFRVVGFIRVRHRGRGFTRRAVGYLVHSGSMDSFGCVLGVVGFIRVRPQRRWVHSGTLCLFGGVLGVVGFNQGGWVHLVAPRVLLGSFGVVRLI